MSNPPKRYEITPKVRQALEEQVHGISETQNWIQIAVLDATREMMAHIRKSFSPPPNEIPKSFENSTWEMRFPVNWQSATGDIASCGEAELQLIADHSYKSETDLWVFFSNFLNELARTKALWRLTNNLIHDPYCSPDPTEHFINLGAFLASPAAPNMTEDQWGEAARRVASWDTTVDLPDTHLPVSVFLLLRPLVISSTKTQAYFPLRCFIRFRREDMVERGTWDAHHLECLWADLQQQVVHRLDFLGKPPLPYSRPNPARHLPLPEDSTALSASVEVLKASAEKQTTMILEIRSALDELKTQVLVTSKLPAKAIDPVPNRICFLDDQHIVVFDGHEIWLQETGKQFLKILHDEYPKYVGERTRKQKRFVARPKRVFDRLPETIQNLIERTSGAGYRLKVK